jgi:hypothetical protein
VRSSRSRRSVFSPNGGDIHPAQGESLGLSCPQRSKAPKGATIRSRTIELRPFRAPRSIDCFATQGGAPDGRLPWAGECRPFGGWVALLIPSSHVGRGWVALFIHRLMLARPLLVRFGTSSAISSSQEHCFSRTPKQRHGPSRISNRLADRRPTKLPCDDFANAVAWRILNEPAFDLMQTPQGPVRA